MSGHGPKISPEERRKDPKFNVPVRKTEEPNIVYKTMIEAFEKTSVHYVDIFNCCEGKQGSAGRVKWEYVR